MTLGTSKRWVSAAVLFKTGLSGSVPTGMRVVHLLHQNIPQAVVAGGNGTSFPTPLNLQVPTSGNLLVAACGGGSSGGSSTPILSSMSDTNGNTWQAVPNTGITFGNTQTSPFYSANFSPSSNLVVTTNWAATNTDTTILFYDVIGAALAPFDVGVSTSGTSFSSTGPVTSGSITPSVAGALVIAMIEVYYDTVNNITGGYIDSNVFDGMSQSGPQPVDQNNGWATFISANTSAITAQWDFWFNVSYVGTISNWAACMMSFKPASSGAAPVITVQPTSQTVTAPASASFSLTATGATSYQWYLGGSAVVGATAATYNTGATNTGETGSAVYCAVTNAYGTTNSNTVSLTVNAAGAATTGLPTTLLLTPTAVPVPGSVPWTFGQVFKQGNVPAGTYPALMGYAASSYQSDIRSKWPDGSAKFAVISAISPWTTTAQQTVTITNGGAANTGANVAEPGALNNTYVTLAAGTGSYPITGGTYAINSVLGIDRSTWAFGSGGRVRQILGPTMSEFHYYQPTSDVHLTLWWYVRAYANGAVEVELGVENGWWNKASPSEKDYSVTVVINGVTTFTQSNVVHPAHAKAGRVDWYANGAPVIPLPRAASLMGAGI